MAGGKSVNADGRRGRNRTCNPRIRNPMLYPFELRARCINSLPWKLLSPMLVKQSSYGRGR